MSDVLGEPIRVRLKPTRQAEYEAIASQRGQKLGTYLRQRLEDEDTFLAELADIRALLEEIADHQTVPQVTATQSTSSTATLSEADKGMLLEVLLLLRSMNPGKARTMQATIHSMGLPVWTSDED